MAALSDEDRRRSLEGHLLRCLGDGPRGMELIGALAGDRPMTALEHAAAENWRRGRGDAFYADVLFCLTHEQFAPEDAKALWNRIVEHKDSLEMRLDRKVGIVVAGLDFLTNVARLIPAATLIPASTLNDVAQIALHDATTGLFGPSAFRMLLHKEMARAERFEEPLSLVILDLDDFKLINDQHGHPTGDLVLANVGRVLTQTLRAADIAARYGGEEFAALLPRTAMVQLHPLLERLRSALAEDQPDLPPITASIGAASFPDHGTSTRELIARADDALYTAKRAGKNRVAIAERG